MIKNYLFIASRNLAKHKTFSIINIGGLAISLASCVFIFYYVFDELTYDRFHQKSDRIYRITQTFTTPEHTQDIRWTHQKIGPYLKQNYPQVEHYVRFEDVEVNIGNTKTREKGIVKTDPWVFEVFTYPLLEGNVETVFKSSNSIVLSESLAKKYFHGDAVGKVVEIEGQPYQVTGIMKDVPRNSDKWISALAYGGRDKETDELSFIYDTYILLHSQEDAGQVSKQLIKAAANLHPSEGQELKLGFSMQALTGLHFHHGTEMDHAKGNKNTIYILVAIGFILLVVAIVNFINLTTVRSLERAREVGVRKVIGAQKGQLTRQFIVESFLSVVLATGLSLVLVQFLKSIFESISGKTVNLENGQNILNVGMILSLLIGIAVASSFYPAWVLSSYKPAHVLKNKLFNKQSGSWIRTIFSTIQFMLSTGLLLFLLVMLFQLDFMRKTDLGFTRNKILVVKIPDVIREKNTVDFYRNELTKSKAIRKVSVGGFASNLGTPEPFASPLWIKEGADERQLILPNISVDKHYPSMLGLQLVHGRSFDELEQETASGAALVNEAFVRMAGWADPLGQTIRTYSGEAQVVGVVKNFHFQSLHNTIEPLVLMGLSETHPDTRYLFLDVSPRDLPEIRTLWSALLPDAEMDYFFLDEYFNAQYTAEENLQVIVLYFTLLTILVAASGLLALTMYHVDLRKREIGIRKVFGADILSLIKLLSGSFMKITGAGILLGLITGIFTAKQWLLNYAYRISIGITITLLPVLIILLISIVIVVYRTYAGARSNPADILKQES